MSTRTFLGAATAAGFALVAMTAYPVVAAPVSTGNAGLKSAAHADVVQVAKKKRHAKKRVYTREAPSVFYQDTVGSLGFDGIGYAYNRFSGQRYMSCMFDEGYGRVRPCDSGGGGGGRN